MLTNPLPGVVSVAVGVAGTALATLRRSQEGGAGQLRPPETKGHRMTIEARDAHPERYLRTHLFATQLLETYRRANGPGPTTTTGFQAVTDKFMAIHRGLTDELPLGERPESVRMVKKELALFTHFAAYHTWGKRLYLVPAERTTHYLDESFDPPAALSKKSLPSPCFHLHFGVRHDWNLWGSGYKVDGAYVSWWDEQHPIQIVLTTRRDELRYESELNMVKYPDRYYYLSFPLRRGQPVFEAVERYVERENIFEPRDYPDTSGVREVAGRQVQVVDRTREFALLDAKELKLGFPIFMGAMRIILGEVEHLAAGSR